MGNLMESLESLDIKTVHYDDQDVELEVSIDNEGWSASDDLEVSKFQSHQAQVPQPLSIHDVVVVEELSFLHRLTMKLSHPGLDCGLGCFGNLSKITETGKKECDDLYWFDFHEILAARELFDRIQIWDDDEWIDFIRLTQTDGVMKTEEQLVEFHAAEVEIPEDVEYVHTRPHNSDADRFLAILDDMESALEEEEYESRTIPTSIKYPRWILRRFRDWIEEADFIEANVTAPSGSRYYTGSTK
ncbi:hypothetical protein F5B19DRAFT_477173 [Rostrohypoxylon terebratum]|nr:hypothetical protein F5B19DRAFT_477173 [Rostrohypoxylon terebratum]